MEPIYDRLLDKGLTQFLRYTAVKMGIATEDGWVRVQDVPPRVLNMKEGGATQRDLLHLVRHSNKRGVARYEQREDSSLGDIYIRATYSHGNRDYAGRDGRDDRRNRWEGGQTGQRVPREEDFDKLSRELARILRDRSLNITCDEGYCSVTDTIKMLVNKRMILPEVATMENIQWTVETSMKRGVPRFELTMWEDKMWIRAAPRHPDQHEGEGATRAPRRRDHYDIGEGVNRDGTTRRFQDEVGVGLEDPAIENRLVDAAALAALASTNLASNSVELSPLQHQSQWQSGSCPPPHPPQTHIPRPPPPLPVQQNRVGLEDPAIENRLVDAAALAVLASTNLASNSVELSPPHAEYERSPCPSTRASGDSDITAPGDRATPTPTSATPTPTRYHKSSTGEGVVVVVIIVVVEVVVVSTIVQLVFSGL